MDHRAALILAASLFGGSAHAFYAQATPPVGFVAGAINTFNGAKAGATASLELGRIAANASLNIGGKTVSLAAKVPLAANAARVAALAIYAHPAVRVGVGVATWVGLTGYLYNATRGAWEQPDSAAIPSDGYEYSAGAGWHGSAQSACSAYLVQAQASGSMHPDIVADGVTANDCIFRWSVGGPLQGYQLYQKRSDPSCPSGWYKTPAGCVQTAPGVPVTVEKFAEELAKHPMPPAVLPELPFDLPVQVPYFEPLFVPTGDPVKNPNYDPTKPQTGENQPYVQPGVKVDPANDAKNPFQVDLKPVNRPVDNPQGSRDPVPSTDPGGSGDGDKPRDPEKDERDLCEKNPEILACQKLSEPEDKEKLPVKEVEFNFTPESGFSGNAVCPPDTVVTVVGHTISVPWHKFCDSLEMIRPMMLAMAWLMAAFILIGRR